ncbi:MAG TPA: hypothetical protein VD761_01955 [Solirubrobacterales bacterium]|nr:hypothetical protein [Solirubrobacterales bacterium]
MSSGRTSYDAVIVGARCAGSPLAAGPIFAGIATDPEAGQNLRDALSRQLRPRSDVFTDERLGRWFAPAGASVGD